LRSFEQILKDCIELQKEKNAKYKRGEDPLSGFIAAAKGSQAKSLAHYIRGRALEKEGRIENYYLSDKLDPYGLIEELEDNINYYAFQIMALERLIPIKSKSADPFKKPETDSGSDS
jgi:hypothetical protein